MVHMPCIFGLYWDNGKENGNYYSILGLYWDNGKENFGGWRKSRTTWDPCKTVLIGVSAKSDGAGFPPATIPLPNNVPILTS